MAGPNVKVKRSPRISQIDTHKFLDKAVKSSPQPDIKDIYQLRSSSVIIPRLDESQFLKHNKRKTKDSNSFDFADSFIHKKLKFSKKSYEETSVQQSNSSCPSNYSQQSPKIKLVRHKSDAKELSVKDKSTPTKRKSSDNNHSFNGKKLSKFPTFETRKLILDHTKPSINTVKDEKFALNVTPSLANKTTFSLKDEIPAISSHHSKSIPNNSIKSTPIVNSPVVNNYQKDTDSRLEKLNQSTTYIKVGKEARLSKPNMTYKVEPPIQNRTPPSVSTSLTVSQVVGGSINKTIVSPNIKPNNEMTFSIANSNNSTANKVNYSGFSCINYKNSEPILQKYGDLSKTDSILNKSALKAEVSLSNNSLRMTITRPLIDPHQKSVKLSPTVKPGPSKISLINDTPSNPPPLTSSPAAKDLSLSQSNIPPITSPMIATTSECAVAAPLPVKPVLIPQNQTNVAPQPVSVSQPSKSVSPPPLHITPRKPSVNALFDDLLAYIAKRRNYPDMIQWKPDALPYSKWREMYPPVVYVDITNSKPLSATPPTGSPPPSMPPLHKAPIRLPIPTNPPVRPQPNLPIPSVSPECLNVSTTSPQITGPDGEPFKSSPCSGPIILHSSVTTLQHPSSAVATVSPMRQSISKDKFESPYSAFTAVPSKCLEKGSSSMNHSSACSDSNTTISNESTLSADNCSRRSSSLQLALINAGDYDNTIGKPLIFQELAPNIQTELSNLCDNFIHTHFHKGNCRISRTDILTDYNIVFYTEKPPTKVAMDWVKKMSRMHKDFLYPPLTRKICGQTLTHILPPPQESKPLRLDVNTGADSFQKDKKNIHVFLCFHRRSKKKYRDINQCDKCNSWADMMKKGRGSPESDNSKCSSGATTPMVNPNSPKELMDTRPLIINNDNL